MAMKAKHAFGALENIDSAKAAGKIDAFDILFVKDANGKPYVGWLDKNGDKVIVDDSAEFAAMESKINTKADASDVESLEGQIATKADAEEVAAMSAQIAEKADASDVKELETEVATKVDAVTVQLMIDKSTIGAIEVIEF